VAAELTRRGVQVRPQVGVAGYRIDLGVLDDALPDRYVCGIECDGVAYRGAETARDRDRLRQQVLEARGWTIHRVWSTDWFKDRPGQIERLIALVERSRAETTERVAAEAEAEERARVTAESDRAAAAPATEPVGAPGGYVRPAVPAYRLADGEGKYAGADFLDAPSARVVAAIVEVVNVESPVHVDDVASRVAGMWGAARVGSRIAAKLQEALAFAARSGLVATRGDFVWSPAGAAPGAAVPVRSRAGMRVPAERIAPEEIEEAITLVLGSAGGLTRDELVAEVRQVLGVGRAVAPAVDDALRELARRGRVGEGSVGYALRPPPG
jgi:very-short-patch-repair endonuclease